MLVLKLS